MRALAKRSLPVLSPERQARQRAEYDPRAHGADCDNCPCNGQTVVPPNAPTSGQAVPDALLIGQDPGHLEVWKRQAFIGPSGKKVDKVLEKYGLQRSRMAITNAALCLPDDEDRPKAMQCCAPRLKREIEALPKNVPIVPLGAHAVKSALGRKVSILKARGFIWRKDGREYYPTLHPAYVLRDSTQYPLFKIDFRRLAKRIHQGYIKLCEPPRYSVPRSIDDLKKALALFKRDVWVSCDIETSRDSPTIAKLQCIGISNGKDTVVIPWMPFFRYLLRQFFAGKTVIGHNFFAFDSIVLQLHGIPVPKIEDTLIAHHCYASHFRQGMDHCVSAYLDSDPWKILYGLSSNDEKGQPKGALSEDDLHLYNAHDAYKQAHLWMAMEKDIAANRELYEHDKQLAEICRDMQLNGVLVDEARRKELSVAIQIKVDRLYKEMVELAGHDFGPNKPKDIRAILFEQFGAPVLEKTEKTGQPSTGKKTLEAFAFQTHEKYGQFAERLGFYRLCKKVQATHIDRLPIEKDGRVHPSWRSFATPTGRWGCRKPNLMAQKIPDNRFANEPEYQIRSIYIAPKDHKYVSFDLEQVEPRMSAYLSGDENFIAAVETGDIHTAVAQIIFEKDGKLPVELKDSKTAKTLGKPMRQVAKKCGLGISYGAGAEKIFETLRADKHKITFTQVVACLSKLQKKFRRYYDFVQENVEGCQWDGYIIVGFLTKRKRHLGHAPKPQEVANCVDAKTEALTQRGWVPGFKLRRDDVLLTKNAGTGRLEWQAMTDLKLYPNYMGRLYEFKSKAFSAVTTPEHRWLVYHNQRDRDEERISSELSLYGDDRIHRTGFYTSPKKKYSDNLIELIGWFLTDGWFNWGSSGLCPTAFLCQSQRANAHKVKMIDNLVERMCMPHSRYYYVSLKLHELFPERVLTPEFLLTITRRQAKLLIKTMMLGDGMVDAFGRRRFCTGKKESAELFQALCVMAGMASTLHKRDQTSSDYQPRCGIHWLVTLLRRDKAQLVKHQRRVFSGKRKVWCPVVPNSFFVARREGKVFITGNSPIQGGAADLMNTRMIELYRWFERVYNKLKKVVRIVAQVHDQVIVEVPDHLVTRVQADIRRIMGRKVRIRDKEVFFPIEEKTGLRWSEV